MMTKACECQNSVNVRDVGFEVLTVVPMKRAVLLAVVGREHDVSEEHFASIFRVEA
jgi:hypothetical protein